MTRYNFTVIFVIFTHFAGRLLRIFQQAKENVVELVVVLKRHFDKATGRSKQSELNVRNPDGKKQWNPKAVVEITDDHPAFPMLSCLRQGLSKLLSNNPELASNHGSLGKEDFEHVLEEQILVNEKTFTFRSYASKVFSRIRQAVDVHDYNLQKSMVTLLQKDNLPFLEYLSNSRSGQHFYVSTDRKYFVKTDINQNTEFFRKMLTSYVAHIRKYPHTLLTRILGLYSVEGPGLTRKNLLVMKSLMFPSEHIEAMFDVKGCFAGRYEKPNPPGSLFTPVLKDQNFWNEKIILGSQRDWFMKQLELDSSFLSAHGVLDYSLLIGVGPLPTEDKKIYIPDSVNPFEKLSFTNGPQEDISKLNSNGYNRIYGEFQNEHHASNNCQYCIPYRTLPEPREDHRSTREQWQLNNGNGCIYRNAFSRPKTGKRKMMLDDDETNQSNARHNGERNVHSFTDDNSNEVNDSSNTRILPNCENSLHIIDGPTHRYHFGIIDFLTVYDLYQKVDCLRKNYKYMFGDHSTLPPPLYANRFLRFFSQRVR